MASKNRKMEEDDDNTDQESKPTNSALNPVVDNEVGSRSRTDEDTGVEQQQLVVAPNQALSYQLAPHFDPVINQSQPHFGTLNQPASSSNPGLLLQQPSHGSLNQPRSSSRPAVNRAPLHQLQSPRGSFNELGSSSNPQQPPHGSLNQPRSSSIPAVNRAPLHQLQSPRGSFNELGSSSNPQQPPHGSLNQPRSSSIPAVNLAPLHQLQSPRGSFNELGSSSNPQQPPHGSLNQPRSSSRPAVNRAPLHQLQSPRGSFNELGSSSNPQQPPHGSLNKPRSSSIRAVNQPSLPQLLHARIIEEQQNMTSKNITVPLTQLGRIMGKKGATVKYIEEVSGATVRQNQNEKLKYTIPFEIRGTKSQVQVAEGLIMDAMDMLLHVPVKRSYSLFGTDTPDPSRVLKCIGIRASRMDVTRTCGSSLCSERGELIQYIKSRFIPPPIVVVNFPERRNFAIVEVVGTNKVIAEVNHLIDLVEDILSTRSGPGSTSRNVIAAPAGGESEGPANTAAGDILSATDADEKQGEEENADTSQDGNTGGNSSAR